MGKENPNRPHDPPEPGTEPKPPYPEGYLEGLRLFNDRRFWDCHEALEEVWLPLDGGPMLFYQAIIQIAAAFHLLTRSSIRWRGARRNLEKALQKLPLYPDRYMGLDVAELTERCRALRDLLHAVETEEMSPDAFDDDRFFTLWPDDAEEAETG